MTPIILLTIALIFLCLAALSWFAGSDAPFVTTDAEKVAKKTATKKAQADFKAAVKTAQTSFKTSYKEAENTAKKTRTACNTKTPASIPSTTNQ